MFRVSETERSLTNLVELGVLGKHGRGYVLVGVFRGIGLPRVSGSRHRWRHHLVLILVLEIGVPGRRGPGHGRGRRAAETLVRTTPVDRYGVELVVPGPQLLLGLLLEVLVVMLLVLAAQPERVELGRAVLMVLLAPTRLQAVVLGLGRVAPGHVVLAEQRTQVTAPGRGGLVAGAQAAGPGVRTGRARRDRQQGGRRGAQG